MRKKPATPPSTQPQKGGTDMEDAPIPKQPTHERGDSDDDDDDDDVGSLCAEKINRMITERSDLREQTRWKEADRIKQILATDPYHVTIFDRSDGVTLWRKMDKPVEKKRVVWNEVPQWVVAAAEKDHATTTSSIVVPLVIATVDTPHYRERLQTTIDHISQICCQEGSFATTTTTTTFRPIPVPLLDLHNHPSIGARRIVMEGWRQILLPHLLRLYESGDIATKDGFVLVAEDDIRFPPNMGAGKLRDICNAVWGANPDVSVLSLGHAWAATKRSRGQRRRQKKRAAVDNLLPNNNTREEESPLLRHLQGGGGVHAATLLAIRVPEGLRCLSEALNRVTRAGQKTHWDQFLFASTLHNVGLALSDPPLVGWAEVAETLTVAGPGHRRMGGGRLGHLPDTTSGESDHYPDRVIRFVKRQVL